MARCPICRTEVDAGSEVFPFCSPRCRLVDLGRWLNEEYRIPSVEPPDPEELPTAEPGERNPDSEGSDGRD